MHGGPEESWFDMWSDRWNPQTIVHQGYAVFAPNYHGGNSYGQVFADSIVGHWGDLTYEDLMKGISYILAAKPYLDANRIFCMGASFGGYLANWMQSQTSLFRAIICHDGLFDLPSFYYEIDEEYNAEDHLLGLPWQKRVRTAVPPLYHNNVHSVSEDNAPITSNYDGFQDIITNPFSHFFTNTHHKNTNGEEDEEEEDILPNPYEIHSPSYYISSTSPHFNTPQLTFHGLKDFCCPSSQGFMAFFALQAQGTPSRLIIYPDENHWVLNQHNSVRWHEEIIGWLQNYV